MHRAASQKNVWIPHRLEISLDGAKIKTYDGEWLVDAITREKGLPHICYHPRLAPSVEVIVARLKPDPGSSLSLLGNAPSAYQVKGD